MKTSQLTWEETLAALLPLVGSRVWATTMVDGALVSAFGEVLRRVDVRPAPFTGVEEMRLDFGHFAGLVFLRRDEHLGTALSEDGGLRIQMLAWAFDLERE